MQRDGAGDRPGMHIDRSTLVAELEKQGKSQKAQQLLQELPAKIDHVEKELVRL